VPDERRRGLAERVDEAEHVVDERGHAVRGQLGGGGGPPVAAHVGGDGVVSGGGERGELVAPGIPELGEAVEEDDGRPLARLGQVQVDAVDGNHAMGDRHVTHCCLPH
jgi:hypothetical protein